MRILSFICKYNSYLRNMKAKEAVDAWFNDDLAYTLQSVYDSAPKF